ncbi:glycerophosphodiester phosphodiesterase [Salinibacterium sp. PAMC 21357]|uniref:glycerophosphodiester phosphodiesterase n=1 Tax=Salinibacterium sp. PAMC 21357 TaxID=1112215 RepID=UPI00028883D7|nr:glycerophosphodiester phosphodiesterase family protein [Salinibacterium sp. PAMC 21357]
MATSQNPASAYRNHPARRAALAAAVVTAITLALVLNANVSRVHAVGAFSSLRSPGEAAFIAGHRGDKMVAPENTLEALGHALNSAADYVETDVQLTADGIPVLMHDWTVDRTTDGTGPVWAYGYDELSSLDAGSWFGDEFAGATVPTLEEFLNLLRWSTKNAILELKGSWTDGQVTLVADLIARHGVSDHVIIGSFDIMTLQALQRVSPELPGMLIVREIVGDPGALAAAAGAVALVTSKKAITQDPELVQRVHDAGLGILIYTLNDSETWSDAVSLGVDGIVTDRPAELGQWIAHEFTDSDDRPFANGIRAAS